jgi:predicted Zn-dependent protease
MLVISSCASKTETSKPADSSATAVPSDVSFPPVQIGEQQFDILQIGKQQAWALEKKFGLSGSSKMLQRVEQVGRKVADASDWPGLGYTFAVLSSKESRAYSTPHGAIYVTEGLVRAVKSDDELAMALGHEIAHTALRHVQERLEANEEIRPLYVRMAQLSKDSKERFQVALQSMAETFDRERELDADRYGALYATRAGFRFAAAIELLERLREKYGQSYSLDEHAVNQLTITERIAELKIFWGTMDKIANLFDIGYVSLSVGKYEPAIKSFQEVLTYFPSSVEVHNNLGAAYYEKFIASVPASDDASAYAKLVRSISIDKRFRVKETLRGEQTPDYEALELAIAEFDNARKLNPFYALAYNNLGLAYEAQGNMSKAMDAYTDATKADKKCVQAYNNLGVLSFVQGKAVEAARQFRKALEIQADYLPAQFNLALTYEAVKDVKSAIEAYNAYLKLDTVSSWARLASESITRLGGQPVTQVVQEAQLEEQEKQVAERRFILMDVLKYTPEQEVKVGEAVTVISYPTKGLTFYATGTNEVFYIEVGRNYSGPLIEGIDFNVSVEEFWKQLKTKYGLPRRIIHSASGAVYWVYDHMTIKATEDGRGIVIVITLFSW